MDRRWAVPHDDVPRGDGRFQTGLEPEIGERHAR